MGLLTLRYFTLGNIDTFSVVLNPDPDTVSVVLNPDPDIFSIVLNPDPNNLLI